MGEPGGCDLLLSKRKTQLFIRGLLYIFKKGYVHNSLSGAGFQHCYFSTHKCTFLFNCFTVFGFFFFYHFKTRIKLLQVTTRGILMCEICIASSHSFQQLHYRQHYSVFKIGTYIKQADKLTFSFLIGGISTQDLYYVQKRECTQTYESGLYA